MRIKSFDFFPYSIKLKKPFLYSGSKIEYRNGFFVKTIDETGKCGYGEAAPLPGFSAESYEATAKALTLLKDFFRDPVRLDKQEINSIENKLNIPASARFGFEQSLIPFFYDAKELKKNFVVNNTGLAGLENPEAVNSRVGELTEKGYGCIKIKAGRQNIEDDILLLNKLSENHPNVKFRVDPNGRWTRDSFNEFVSGINTERIEFIEEPLHGYQELAELEKMSRVPVAPDESLANCELLNKAIDEKRFRYIIVKPMLTGSFFRLAELIIKAREAGINIIVSSSFESRVGFEGLLLLAAGNKNLNHGLGTFEYFPDYIYNSITKDNGSVISADGYHNKIERLTGIYERDKNSAD